MGPYTLEALQADLDQLTTQMEAAKEPSAAQLSGTEHAILQFRIQMLQTMLDELETDGRPATQR